MGENLVDSRIIRTFAAAYRERAYYALNEADN
jgi:hypothetical protein